MAPTAPRPTPHEDALLDRTGIICASGHGPAAPPTPGMNRSGAAGFVAFVVMVLAAVTGVSGLDGDGAGSRLVAGDEATEAAPQVPDGTGSDEQGGDVPGAGTDEKPGDAPQRRKGTDVPAGPVSPDAGAHSDEVRVSDDTAIVPAADALAHGLEAPVPGVARAEPAAAGTNATGSEVASARKADTAAQEATTRTSGTPVAGAWTAWQDRSARDRSSVEQRVQRFGEELRRTIENHVTRHYDLQARDTGERSRDAGESAQTRPGVDENDDGGQVRSGDGRAHRGGRDMSQHAVDGPRRHDGGLPGPDAVANASPDTGVDRHGYGGYGDEQPSYEGMNRTPEPRVDGARDDGYYGGRAHDGPDHRGGAYGGHGYGGYGGHGYGGYGAGW